MSLPFVPELIAMELNLYTVAGNAAILLYAAVTGALTPPALLVTTLLSAVNAAHQWGAFHAVFVLALSGIVLSRSASEQAKRRSSRPVLSALSFATLLVGIHAAYLYIRLGFVPTYHLQRLPQGCLAIPSPTLQNTYHNTFPDSLANQLPYGIAISYAMTVASVLSAALGITGSLSRLLTSLVGAVIPSLTFAALLPMCVEGLDGADELASHIDRRATAWKERNAVFWSPEARYGAFVSAVAFNAAMGSAVKLTRSEVVSNMLVTATVVLGMALWSINGNSKERVAMI